MTLRKHAAPSRAIAPVPPPSWESTCVLKERTDRDGARAGAFDRSLLYPVQPDQLAGLKREFGAAFDPGGRDVHLRTWHPTDELPYKVHGNRELLLMLAGTKPLAAFDLEPGFDAEEEYFAPYVTAGRFVRREFEEAGRRQVFYARTGRGGYLRTSFAPHGCLRTAKIASRIPVPLA